jgi:excisionase family DNA binding protein
MNKKETAAELGITTRTLERHMSGGRIAYARRQGKTGEEAFFDPAEIARFKAELRSVTHSPAVAATEAPTSSDQPRQMPSQALERAGGAEGMQAFALMIADALRDAQAHADGQAGAPSIADLAHKLALTLPEAARVSGLSANHLRTAVHDGKLKARIVGRGWKIKPEELRAYVGKVMK